MEKDRFAVLQERDRQSNPQSIRVNRPSLYGATYWPWIRLSDPRTQDTLLVPPGGHMLGIYARTDIERGVHKAPANEQVRGIVTRDLPGNLGPLEFKATKEAQDILKPRGINTPGWTPATARTRGSRIAFAAAGRSGWAASPAARSRSTRPGWPQR